MFLTKQPMNETAISCNMKLLDIVKQHLPGLKKTYFWSNGCSSQFRSRFTFQSMILYQLDLQISWDYGEAHPFKGPYNYIGELLVKRRVYQYVSSSKVI